MSNFDLSMSNFLVPGLRNYQPKVGKMKSPGVSLTTLEVVNNMATPYTRVFTMTDGDTVSGPVEADCTVIYRTTASQQLDLTSLNGSPGVKINFILEGTGSLELALSSGVQRTTHTLTPQASIAQVYPLNSGGMQLGWVVGSSGGSGGGTVGVNIFDAIYPVGSLYWSSKSTNPGTLFGGTWVQIKDRFVLAAGDIYTNGATGGNANTTLTESNLPNHSHGLNNHTHGFTPAGTVSAHNHGLNYHTHGFSATTGGTGKHSHNVAVGAMSLRGGDQGSAMQRHNEGADGSFDFSKGYYNTQTGDHSHTVSGTTGAASGNTASATPTFSGTAGTTGAAGGNTTAIGSGAPFSIMPPYIVMYCWERTA